MTASGRMLGFDVGDSRIGVALSDELGMFAQPHCSVERTGKSDAATVSELERMITTNKIGTIVVGFPIELTGNIGPQALKVRKLMELLQLRLTEIGYDAQFVEWDERMTTAQAERVIAGTKLKNRQKSAALDRVSAAIILQSYLDGRSRSLPPE